MFRSCVTCSAYLEVICFVSGEMEPQLSIQPPFQPELGKRLKPPPLLLADTEQQTQIERETHQHQAKPLWIKHRKLLLLLLGFSLCAALVGCIYIISRNPQSKNQTGPVTCVSPACQQASARLSASADPFTKPCDYFLFTCGSDTFTPESRGRRMVTDIPGSPWNWDGTTERENREVREEKILDREMELLQYLREILESRDINNSSAVQKTRTFYHSCLDTSSIETAGVKPFLTLIQKLGGWAVSGPWNRTDFNSTLSTLMRDYATFPFFNVHVGKDPKDAAHGKTKQYIQIDQPDLLIPIEWNNETQKSRAKSETLRPFLALCQRYLALLGAPPSSSIMHVGTFMSLSSELAVAATPLQHRLSQGQLYQRMSIRELQIQAPAIDWLGCLQAIFQPLPLEENDHILVHNLPYIVHMSSIIGKWQNKHELSNTGPLQTYMVLNLLNTLMPALDSRFSETAATLSEVVDKSDGVAPRWKRCVLETERGFDSVLTHLLSERTSHKEAEEIIHNIMSTFKSQLHKLKWTNQTSLQTVMEKVQSLIPRTTHEISSEAELDLLFSTASVSSHSFFSNYVQLLSLWQKRRRKVLSEQTTPVNSLSVTPLLLGNKLLFPMGMFIPPVFHPTYPRAMNYGVVGFLIAKDILHLLLPDIYSQSETVHAVGECVWTHYLTVTENVRRGGVLSLSVEERQEVWVQYSALQIALQAYHQSLQTRPRDTFILGFSHTRLFLSSFSQVNCDIDLYHEFMPLEPSFLVTVICATSHLCPTSLRCPSKTQQPFLQTC
ncbi:kell blood group glycoprotein isoform X1 [Solea solea]|uniref:kell blood group glycoprotein isoform X1 n=1 Tax=Solea solea TaxID=90069 RepID=UPI00272D9934|nr:kell blood group glycoprotein isoform X1 [Solea solea]